MHRNLINWLALFHTEGVGPVKFKNFLAIDYYLDNLPKIANASLHKNKHLIDADLNWSQQDNCHIVLFCDPEYPKLMKNIHDPPPILFVRGNKDVLINSQIAIVGSRRASKLGEKIASNFALELAKFNIVITSGLALGIDTASHKGAMNAIEGKTIAVLGSGLNIIYPRQNIKLAEQIIATGGAIVSEFSFNTQPLPINFPRRNRVISGLSLGTVVIEASIDSGSLITANYALEQGREVFAVPGCIYDQKVKGCHKLIKQGAKLVENVAEILEDLKFAHLYNNFNHKLNDNVIDDLNKLNNLDKNESKVLNYVSYQITPADLIIARSGLMANIVNAALVNLELSGYITSVPGGYMKLI